VTFSHQKILVTGADGFIGSHLCEELVRTGHDIRAFVLYNSFNSWGWLDHSAKDIQENIEVFTGDIRDPYGVKEAMKGCDLVIHLAALIAIPYSYHSPSTYVVVTSTSEVYGTARFVPITEDHPLQGQSPYSASKIGADQVAMSFYHAFNTPVAIIRPFNTYGPRQSARAVIPTTITQIANGKRRLKLGALYPTRDFNYVRDTVRGFMAVASSSQSVGEVINIGSNYEISIGDTVKLIAEVMGAEIEVETDEVRLRPAKSEVERLWADNTKAKTLLGWEPLYNEYEGFKRGLSETVDWFANPENLKQYKANVYNI
jgi:nucleoside-diphosphate-sugar epimerase